MQVPRIDKHFEKKKKVEGPRPPDFKTYYKANNQDTVKLSIHNQ